MKKMLPYFSRWKLLVPPFPRKNSFLDVGIISQFCFNSCYSLHKIVCVLSRHSQVNLQSDIICAFNFMPHHLQGRKFCNLPVIQSFLVSLPWVYYIYAYQKLCFETQATPLFIMLEIWTKEHHYSHSLLPWNVPFFLPPQKKNSSIHY